MTMRGRFVEIVVLGITIILAVCGSYVATVRAITITDERSKTNTRRIVRMEKTWMDRSAVRALNKKIDSLMENQSEIREIVIELRTEMRLSRDAR